MSEPHRFAVGDRVRYVHPLGVERVGTLRQLTTTRKGVPSRPMPAALVDWDEPRFRRQRWHKVALADLRPVAEEYARSVAAAGGATPGTEGEAG